eukprot:12897272-Prorocentrum_lima.AAC.1
MKHLANQSEQKVLLTFKGLKEFMKGGGVDGVTAFSEGRDAFLHCAVGPQDAVFLPLGWSFGERDCSDVYGVRYQLL